MAPPKRKLNDAESDDTTSQPNPKLIKHVKGPMQKLECPRVDGNIAIRAPPFQYPFQLVSFSYTPERVLEFNNSALKYYVHPPLGADLTYRIDHWIKRAEERGRLDGLLRACLHDKAAPDHQRAAVVSWRGVMTKILTLPYETRDGWDLNVMQMNNTLYFEEHVNDEKLQEKERNMTERNRQSTYMGYAFESYCTSAEADPLKDAARQNNGWSGDVDTNVQWCSVVKTKLGDYRLLIGGEVDCIKGKYTGQPGNFVELKTSMTIRNQGNEVRFERKLLKFYFQSFLLGVPEIVVGFRTPAGRLTGFQTFKTTELPRLVRGKPHAWDPNLCLDWGYRFIRFVESNIRGHEKEPSSSTDDPPPSGSGRTPVWRIRFRPGDDIGMYLLDDEEVQEVINGEERVGFLPTWFWDEVSKPNQSSETSTRSNVQIDAGPQKQKHSTSQSLGWVI